MADSPAIRAVDDIVRRGPGTADAAGFHAWLNQQYPALRTAILIRAFHLDLERREGRHISLHEFAERAHVPEDWLQHIEEGSSLPSLPRFPTTDSEVRYLENVGKELQLSLEKQRYFMGTMKWQNGRGAIPQPRQDTWNSPPPQFSSDPVLRPTLEPNPWQKDLDRAIGDPREYMRDARAHHMPVGEGMHRQIMKRYVTDHYPTAPENGRYMYIGVAGFHNLEMLATGRYNYGLLIDTNPNQARFWQGVIQLLKNYPTPEGFRRAFNSRVESVNGTPTFTSPLLGPDGQPERIAMREAGLYDPTFSEAADMFEFIRQPSAYARLRDMAVRGRLLTQTVDLLHEPERVLALRQWIDSRGFEVRTVYASNIMQDFTLPHPSRNRMQQDFYCRLLPADAAALLDDNLAALGNRPDSATFNTSSYTGSSGLGSGVITRFGTQDGQNTLDMHKIQTLRLKVVHLMAQRLGYWAALPPNQQAAGFFVECEHELAAEIRLAARLVPYSQRHVIYDIIEDGIKRGAHRRVAGGQVYLQDMNYFRRIIDQSPTMPYADNRVVFEEITGKSMGIVPQTAIPSGHPEYYNSDDFLRGIDVLGGPSGGTPPQGPPLPPPLPPVAPAAGGAPPLPSPSGRSTLPAPGRTQGAPLEGEVFGPNDPLPRQRGFENDPIWKARQTLLGNTSALYWPVALWFAAYGTGAVLGTYGAMRERASNMLDAGRIDPRQYEALTGLADAFIAAGLQGETAMFVGSRNPSPVKRMAVQSIAGTMAIMGQTASMLDRDFEIMMRNAVRTTMNNQQINPEQARALLNQRIDEARAVMQTSIQQLDSTINDLSQNPDSALFIGVPGNLRLRDMYGTLNTLRQRHYGTHVTPASRALLQDMLQNETYRRLLMEDPNRFVEELNRLLTATQNQARALQQEIQRNGAGLDRTQHGYNAEFDRQMDQIRRERGWRGSSLETPPGTPDGVHVGPNGVPPEGGPPRTQVTNNQGRLPGNMYT